MLTEEQQHIKKSLFRRVLRFVPTNKEQYAKKKVALFLALLAIAAGAYLIYTVTQTVYLYTTNFSAADIVYAFAGDLKTDNEGRTNVLLLGIGGGEHDGADLTDTIIIASLNGKKNTASMISIPRDLWLDIPGYGSSRINKIYENLKPIYGSEKALDVFRSGVENITGLDIPYYIKGDFKAVIDVVDLLGGIELDVPTAIYDTTYPNSDETGYETFKIDAGPQTLDGETALKYARSRHSTSDFDRAERQQMIIRAVKDKAKNSDILTSPLLIKQLFDQFQENVETNLKITELITMARIAKDFDRENIVSQVIKDQDVVQTGSFLYTPERELYGGAFVLIPMGESFGPLQRFIKILFDHPEFFREKATVEIMNGTTMPGLAADLYGKFIPFGVNTKNLGNAEERDRTTTTIRVNNPGNSDATVEVLKSLLPFTVDEAPDTSSTVIPETDITITLGKDYAKMAETLFIQPPTTK